MYIYTHFTSNLRNLEKSTQGAPRMCELQKGALSTCLGSYRSALRILMTRGNPAPVSPASPG